MALNTKLTDYIPLGVAAKAGGIVVVEIGLERERYEIHKALLIYHSEYFKAALGGSWEEAEDSKVALEDVDQTTFNIFLHWIYTRTIPKNNEEWLHIAAPTSVPDDLDSRIKEAELMQLKAIVFGDRMLASGFKQAVQAQFVNALIKHEACAHYSSIAYAYTTMANDDPILDLLPELHVRHWQDEDDRPGFEELSPSDIDELSLRAVLPPSFSLRVMKKFAKYKGIQGADYPRLIPENYY